MLDYKTRAGIRGVGRIETPQTPLIPGFLSKSNIVKLLTVKRIERKKRGE
jgi:hypothetical protein